MKKIYELGFDELDWLVAKALKLQPYKTSMQPHTFLVGNARVFCPSAMWQHTGQLLDARPWLLPRRNDNPGALHRGDYVSFTPALFPYYGPTPQVAACRACVAGEFGSEGPYDL